MTCPEYTMALAVEDFVHNEMEFHLAIHESGRLFGTVMYIYTAEMYTLFGKYKKVVDELIIKLIHFTNGPTDQTWAAANIISPAAMIIRCCLSEIFKPWKT